MENGVSNQPSPRDADANRRKLRVAKIREEKEMSEGREEGKGDN